MKKSLIALLLLTGVLQAQTDRAVIDSLNSLGRDYIFSNIDSSITLYRNTIDDARALDYPAGEAKALHNLGVALYLKGDYDESVEVYLEAIRLYESLGMSTELAQSYGDLGYQMKRRDLPRAKEYMRQGIDIAEQNNARQVLTALYDNYGVLQEMSERPDSARYYYQKALDLKTALNDSIGIPYSLNNLAGIYTAQGNYQAAANLLRRSDWYRQREEGNYGRLVNSVLWGDLFYQQGALDSAIYYYSRTIAMPGAFEQNYLVSYCYEQLASIYEKREDYENAYRNQKNYVAYRDSLVNIETNERIAELEIEYETEKKDRMLAENRLNIARRERQVALLGGGIIILLLVGIGGYKYQQMRHRQQQKELELRNQLKQAEYEQEIADEKLRISRELHDNIGSQLTFLISSLDNLGYRMEEDDLKSRLDDLGDFGRSTLNELRNTVWAVKHENAGLDALLMKFNELKRHFGDHKNGINLQIEDDLQEPVEMSSTQMLNLLRITQEALQNAVKHAEASEIVVSVQSDSRGFSLTVADDGSGFNPDEKSRGNGLANMRQRCEEAGGEFRIDSGETGTTIACTFQKDKIILKKILLDRIDRITTTNIKGKF